MNTRLIEPSEIRTQQNRLAGISQTIGIFSLGLLLLLVLVWLLSIKYIDFMLDLVIGKEGYPFILLISRLGIPVVILGAITAILLGIIALFQIRRFRQAGKGHAVVGIVLGSVALAPLLYTLLVILPLIGRMLDSVYSGLWN